MEGNKVPKRSLYDFMKICLKNLKFALILSMSHINHWLKFCSKKSSMLD